MLLVSVVGTGCGGRESPGTAWDVGAGASTDGVAREESGDPGVDGAESTDVYAEPTADEQSDDAAPAQPNDEVAEPPDWCAAWGETIALEYLGAPLPEQMAAVTKWLTAMPRSNEQQLLLAGHVEGVARFEANGWELDADYPAYLAILEGSTGTSVDGLMSAWPDRETCELPDIGHPEMVIGYARCLDQLAPWFEHALAPSEPSNWDAAVEGFIAALAGGGVSPVCMSAFSAEHPPLVYVDALEVLDPRTIELINAVGASARQKFAEVSEAIE